MAGYSQGHAIASLKASTLIAGIFSDVRGGEDAATANARLIVAAPEMLEALRKAAAYIQDDIGQSGARMDYADTDALTAINAAIAKATGGQP